jgi:uncharacterized protein (DUF1786 family)
VGRPYKLGESDCFSLVVQYLAFCGINTPSDLIFRGHKISEYPKDYKEKPVGMMGVAVAYVGSVTMEIPPHKATAGDILFVEMDDNKSLVIDGGNGIIIAATEDRGIVALNQHHYKILRAFRCQQNH